MIRKNHHRPYLLIIFIATLLTGCGAPLRYTYSPPVDRPAAESINAHAIYLAPVQDRRKDIKDINKIGELRTTVINMTGSELILSEKPAVIVREALLTEFSRAGFKVTKDSSDKDTDYILNTELREFHLNIASQDKINITLYIELIKAESNITAWSGIVDISEMRYAGVSGDSRRSITKYITTSMEKVIKKAVSRTEKAIRETRSGQGSESDVSNKMESSGSSGEDVSEGIMSIKTQPLRAKIYLDGIYYGLSPQRLHLRPGIYELKIKKAGFIEYSEKVAVGKERETEIEEELSKKP
ncbi:MAG: PEGA domain-containing protein [Thermodesulfobacteriota bacterium]